jgi:L-aminopeptidase/D-esterase-like protein
VARVPIVPGAVIFDLSLGDPNVRPDSASGYAACQAASEAAIPLGTVGAGTGATIGKVLGFNLATKGGLGSVSRKISGDVIVAALAVVNAFGEVRDPQTGRVIAGPRNPVEGGFVDSVSMMEGIFGQSIASMAESGPAVQNTTLAVVATNAALTKAGATKVAQMAHDGLARTIRPIHTMFDGDTIFALSLGERRSDVNLIGTLAADVVAEAVVNAVHAAEGLAGVPAARELTPTST